MYYDYHDILSYNALINIIITQRGLGKSYGIKKYVIDKFLKKGEMFIYLRRYNNELQKIFQDDNNDFFQDIKSEYISVNLKAKAKKFYCNDVICGVAYRLTEAQDLKSSTFDKYTTIIFDEYFIEKGRRHYLQQETMILLNVLDTVMRNRNNVRLFILGNAVEEIEYSPIFSYFNLSLPEGKRFKLFKDNTIVVNYEMPDVENNPRKDTLLAKLVDGTTYGDYAMKNQIINKSDDFIAAMPAKSRFAFAFIFEGQTLGVWLNMKVGAYFVSEKWDKSTSKIFAMSLADFSPNTLLFASLKRYAIFNAFLNAFKISKVYFENQTIKHYTIKMIQKFLSYR